MFKQINHLFIFLLIACIAFTSCKTHRNILFDHANLDSSSGVVEIQKGNANFNIDLQIIKPGDDLEINNLKSEALISGIATSESAANSTQAPQTYTVNKDSIVVLPVIGKTKLGGLSIAKATEFINQIYEKTLLQSPIITLRIANKKVTLLGEFSQPGNYPLVKDKTHLIEMVGVAGGLLKQANSKQIKIIRGDLTNPQILLVDLTNLKSIQDQRLFLQNNDVVYAEPSLEAMKEEANNSRQSIISISLAALNILLVIFNLTK